MKIQTKTLAIFFSSFIGLSLIVSLFLNEIISDNYLQLEQAELKKHLQRAVNIINLEKNNLLKSTEDWANWNDTYRFIQDKNTAYIQSNVVSTTYINNNLAFIAYIKKSGEIVHGRAYDTKLKHLTSLPNDLVSYLKPGKKLLSPTKANEAISELISLPSGVFFISSYSILTSDGEGPSPGVLIFGRRFDDKFITKLSNTIKLNVKFHPYNNVLTTDLKNITQQLSNKEQYVSRASDEINISGYALIKDFNNNPILLFQLDSERSLYQQGVKTTNYISLTIIIFIVAMMLVVFFLMRFIILNRILTLSNEVNDIQDSKNISKRVTESSDDEITSLSHNINSMLSTIQDINRDLDISKKLSEDANRAKTEFLSRMNHELRTPLNAILGFTQLLENDFSNSDPETSKDNIHEIKTAGNYLLGLINGILDLSAIEERNYNISITDVNISDLINNCISMLSPLAVNKNISLHNDISKNEKYIAQADPLALQQIIINLINNAIKYNKENGQVHVECAYTSESTLTIRIIDTGVGIPSSELDNIFEPFNRINTNTTIEGTGIGLTVVKKLTELMNGKINVESKLGEGCCFILEFSTVASEP